MPERISIRTGELDWNLPVPIHALAVLLVDRRAENRAVAQNEAAPRSSRFRFRSLGTSAVGLVVLVGLVGLLDLLLLGRVLGLLVFLVVLLGLFGLGFLQAEKLLALVLLALVLVLRLLVLRIDRHEIIIILHLA